MYGCFSKRSSYLSDMELREQRAKSKEIDKYMKKEKRRMRTRHNILLLGTGESGKSTFLKQMKLINGKKFTEMEIKRFKDTIYDNIYKGILFLIHAQQTIQIPLENSATQVSIDRIEAHYKLNKNQQKDKASTGDLIWTEEEFLLLVDDCRLIWADKAMKEAFNNRSKMYTENFSENSRYYLNNLDRIGVKNYMPDNVDIVWSRKPTDSIIEEEIPINNLTIVFIDVGGQTKERKKWCQMFQDMNTVLFLICSSHYDEYYYDRMSREYRNKLREALRVFSDLINVSYFTNVSVIILFNKTDILTEKVASNVSSICDEFGDEFPADKDPHNLEHVKEFLSERFVSYVDNPSLTHMNHTNNNRNSNDPDTSANSRANDHRYSLSPNNTHKISAIKSSGTVKKRTLYRHFTTAIDRGNIATVFQAMRDTILEKNLNQLVMR